MKIPPGWTLTRLGQITEKIQDGNYGANYPKKNEFVETGIPFLTGRTLNGTKIIQSEFRFISPNKHASLQKAQLQTSDVIFANRGNLGSAALIPQTLDNANIGPQLTLLRANRNEILPSFLHQYFLSELIFKEFRAATGGSALKFFGIGATSRFKILLPPMGEQRKIAEILGMWDEAIRLTEELIAAKVRRKRGLMQVLLTGKVRFPEFVGSEERVETKIGVFPAEWEVVCISDCVKLIMGQSPPSENYNSDGIGLPLVQGNADIANKRTEPRVFTSQITKECKPNDLILSVRAPVGEIARSQHHACIGRGVCAMRPITVDNEFLYQYLLFNEQKWLKYAQGSTFTAINSKDITKFQLCFPSSRDEQQKIGHVLKQCDQEIDLLRQKAAALRTQKKGLMQQLLTGNIRVTPSEGKDE